MGCSRPIVFLDTETTGLDTDAEVIEIAVLSEDGFVLLDTLVKPSKPMPFDCEAIRIHGISNDKLLNAPFWPEVYGDLLKVLDGKDVVIYNAQYDLRILQQTCEKYGLPSPLEKATCAMLAYAQWFGEINPCTGDYRWHSLSKAARFVEEEFIDQHRALIDCKAALAVWRAIYSGSRHDFKKRKYQEKSAVLQNKIKQVLDSDYVVFSINADGRIGSRSILEISVIDKYNNVLINTFIRPNKRIGKQAKYLQRLNMQPEDFDVFPSWADIYLKINHLIENKVILGASGFELIFSENEKYGISIPDFVYIDLSDISTHWKNAPWRYDWMRATDEILGAMQHFRSLDCCYRTQSAIQQILKNGMCRDYYDKD